MAANNTPIFPAAPYMKVANLGGVVACNTRAPIPTANLAAKGLVALTDVSPNGLCIDAIIMKSACSGMNAPSLSGCWQLWIWDGTNAYLFWELTPGELSWTLPKFNDNWGSTTQVSLRYEIPFNYLKIPPGMRLYVSQTVSAAQSAGAVTMTAVGGAY